MRIHPVHFVLRKAFLFQAAHPVPVFLLALLLAAASIFYTVRNLEFQTGQKDLISPKERLVQLAEEVNQFAQLDSFVGVIESPDPRRSVEFLETLAPRLEKDKENYREIFYRVDPRTFQSWALLYLERKDLAGLVENVREHRRLIEGVTRRPTLVNFFEQVNEGISSRMVGELFTGFLDEPSPDSARGPLDLGFLLRVLEEMKKFLDGELRFASPWESLFRGEPGENGAEEGYFWTGDKHYLIFFVTPTQKKDFAGTWHSLSALRKEIARVGSAFPGVSTGVTGLEALNADQMSTALEDMSLATLVSMGALAALLIVFWRGLRRPLLEVILLLIALSFTFGLTTLFIGHLNILSVTFAPLLLGLGIDYGVHWFARYREMEQRGFASPRQAQGEMMERLGPGVLLAGLTAAFSFFPLVLTGFKGLVELGVICSLGLAVMVLMTLFLLPAMVLLFDRPERPRFSGGISTPLEPFLKLTRPRVLALLGLGTLGFAVSLWGAGKVKFDLNMLRLQSPGVESVIWEKKLLAGSGLSSTFGEVLARSLGEVREKTKALAALPSVLRVESIDSLLPKEQEEKLELLGELKPVLGGLGRALLSGTPVNLKDLERVLGRIQFKMDPGKSPEGMPKALEAQMARGYELIGELRRRLNSSGTPGVQKALAAFERSLIEDLEEKLDILRANVNARPMVLKDIPPPLLERFRSRSGLFLIRVYPKENIWEPEILGRFVRDLGSVDANAIGDPVTLYVFTRAFRDGCIKAALYAVVFIFILLLLTFRNLVCTLFALVPLVAGTAWTLGLMNLLGVDLNLANSLFLPLVVGAGVEYGIIIIARWRQREKGVPPLPFSTGMGVILAGLTTTAGFGSLTLSAHRGIFSLGLLTTVGSLAILAAAVFYLPALLQFFQYARKGKSTGSAPGES